MNGTARTPDQRPTVCIGLLTRNRWDDLARCLDSLRGQAAAADVPIVVLVNGSEDDSAHRLRVAYPEVEVHETEVNLGCPGGRNHLAELCTTEWIAHVDDDGTVGESFVEVVLAEVADAPAGRAVIAGNVVDVEVNPDAVFVSGATSTFLGGISVIRTAEFLRLGGYPDDGLREGEEAELSIKLHDEGLDIHRAAGLVLHHPLAHSRAKRRELLRTGLRQSLLTGFRLCPWWMLPVWTAWKLVIYLKVAIQLRSPGLYGSGLMDVARALPAVLRTRQPVGGRAMLASSGRFGRRPS